MEKFGKKLKMRIRVSWLIIILLLAVMVIVGEMDAVTLLDSRSMDRTAQDASRIIFFGALIWQIVRIVRTKRLLRRSLERRERQIIEEDERRIAIRQRSGALAMDILLALLFAAVFFLAYVDMAAFYTAYWTLLAALALKGGLTLYYSKMM